MARLVTPLHQREFMNPAMTTDTKTAVGSNDALPAIIGTPARFLLLLFCWFGFHTILRTWLSPTANLDEAEQLMLTQQWSLGYGPQPPLYTWLQAGVFAITGVSIFSLALLKNALLFGTYSLAYFTGRMATGTHHGGALATLFLFFIPQIVWESQRDLTHSVLASTLAVATLFSLLRAHRHRSITAYLLLGAVIGLGTLAKYNFLIWVVGLLIAALTMREFRGTILNWRALPSLLLALIIIAPHGTWALANRDRVTQTAKKFEINQKNTEGGSTVLKAALPAARARAQGIGNMLWAILRFMAPLGGVFAVLLWGARSRLRRHEALPPCAALIVRALLIVGGLLVLLILATGATGFKDRWFQPILICSPIALAVWSWNAWDHVLVKRLLWLVCIVMTCVVVFLPGKVIFAKLTGRVERLNFPLPELGRQLAARIPKGTPVIADSPFLAGNLRLGMPEHSIYSVLWHSVVSGSHCAVWDAHKSNLPPQDLVAEKTPGGSSYTFLEAPLRSQSNRTYRLGTALIEPGDPSAEPRPK